MRFLSFKTFLKEAATAGTDLEYSIEQSWVEQKPIAYKAISSEAAEKILKYLQNSHLGAEPGQVEQIGYRLKVYFNARVRGNKIFSDIHSIQREFEEFYDEFLNKEKRKKVANLL